MHRFLKESSEPLMAIYTRLNLGEINQIVEAWKLEVIAFSPMGFGSANSNFKLETTEGENYLLNIAEESTQIETERTAKVLKWVTDHKFKTTIAILTRDQKWTSEYQGKTVMVRSFIPGNVILKLSEGMLNAVGENMSGLHRIPIPEILPTTNLYESDQILSVLGSDLEPDYEKWSRDRVEMLKNRILPDLPKGFVHGDLFPDNIIWDSRNFQAFIDFENAFHYYLAYDLGMAITGLCTTNNQLDLEKMSALIDAYQFYRELEENEKLLLQTFAELAAIQTSNWRYWKFRHQIKDPAKSKKHLEMKQLALNIKSIPKEKFLHAINQ